MTDYISLRAAISPYENIANFWYGETMITYCSSLEEYKKIVIREEYGGVPFHETLIFDCIGCKAQSLFGKVFELKLLKVDNEDPEFRQFQNKIYYSVYECNVLLDLNEDPDKDLYLIHSYSTFTYSRKFLEDSLGFPPKVFKLFYVDQLEDQPREDSMAGFTASTIVRYCEFDKVIEDVYKMQNRKFLEALNGERITKNHA